jgi:hypothetical protein
MCKEFYAMATASGILHACDVLPGAAGEHISRENYLVFHRYHWRSGLQFIIPRPEDT